MRPGRTNVMLRALSIVISIGLADSVNVSTIGPALVLASGEHPRRSVLEFALGVVVVFFLGGALLILGPGRALLALVPHPSPTIRYIVETVVGVSLIAGGVVLRTQRRSRASRADARADRREASDHEDDSAQLRPDDDGHGPDRGAPSHDEPTTQPEKSPVLMGAGIALAELPTAFPYFAAIAAIVAARLPLWQELLLVAVYDICFVLPLFAIVLVLRVGGERATQTLDRIRTHFQTHWHTVAFAAALVAGVYVTVLGVTGLASGASGRTGRMSRRIRHVIAR